MSARITVTGINEFIAYVNRIVTGIDTKVIQPTSRESAQMLVDKMRERMHKRSGRMFSSTRITPIQNGFAAIVGVPYAVAENRRAGSKRTKRGTGFGTPHKFVEPSIAEVEKGAFERLMVRLGTFLQTG